ncbi:prolipoprotein diacylglyceryl transferase [Arthrobacter sp. NEB 688]|uniref:prolipoprotein diacylglyceryl transferase n=1 Tax=Arthrobacter sp. NEB 688 TaxID=904039 RepID=UPI0015664C27|nr:prolipoprotein diacylglyceryl transferase [Arthrobacter sp. NEB 688]QKE84907.1 prolipoprotein diacylglyceryl transferase [Arthrobacter sp. NEB 688]
MTTYLPSPTVAAFDLGPLTIRAYALCILAGIVLAVWLTGRRLAARGVDSAVALDVSAYAVILGIIGGRLYHVVTTPGPYFGEGGHLVDALKIWNGGLGIWGAIALGAVGVWIGCRRAGVPFLTFADAAVPGVAFAQAIGRWGNWFNNELHGGPTTLPWGLTVHQWDQSAGRAVTDASGDAVVAGVYHPTFLYESIFLVVLGFGLLALERRRRLAPGQLLGLYVAGYPIGRIVVEKMRTDEAELILGQRLNVWTSIVVFLLGVWIVWHTGRRARREPAAQDEPVVAGPSTTERSESQDVG